MAPAFGIRHGPHRKSRQPEHVGGSTSGQRVELSPVGTNMDVVAAKAFFKKVKEGNEPGDSLKGPIGDSTSLLA
jgi:hypothetical protein